MTEEKTNSSQTIKRDIKPVSPPRSYRRAQTIRRVLMLSSLFLLITIVDSLVQYTNFRAWQILADASGILISLIILVISLILHNRDQTRKAINLIPLVIIFGYAPGDLFLEGVTIYNLISGLILFALAYLFLRPKNPPQWLRSVAIYIALVIIFSIVNLFPRFDISQSPSWQSSLPIFTAVISILLIWQILVNIPIRSIQTRLLVLLVGLSFVPILIATAATTIIGFQRDIQQAENYLQSVSNLKENQIETWLNQTRIDLNLLADNPQFLNNLDALIAELSLRTNTNDPIIEELRSTMLELQVETGRFLDISIVSLDGEILISTSQEIEGQNISQDPNFRIGRTQTHYSPLIINSETGKPAIQLYQPVSLTGEETAAIIFGNLATELIVQNISDSNLLGETGEVYLVNESGLLLTHLKNNSELIPGISTIDSNAIYDVLTNFGSKSLRTENYLDQPVIGAYSWIPSLNTALVIEQTEREAFQNLQLNLTINTSIGIVTLVITITIAFITARNFSEPIRKLSEDAAKVWGGELDRIQTIDRVDEIGELSHTLSNMSGQLVKTTTDLEKTVSERTQALERRARYLETTSQISRALTTIYDVDNLLNTVVHLINENFGFYHIGIFLIDDRREYAVLRAANSEAGWRMLAREHKLRIGEQGIVGYVTGSGAPRIQQQVSGEDSIHFENQDLPLTRSELALPLKVGSEVFGALDVQSTEEEAFSEEDVKVLQILADTVAVSIQNTRLIQRLQESLETEKRIYGDISREEWTALLGQKSTPPAFRSEDDGTLTVSTPITHPGKQALVQGKTILGSLDEEKKIYPIAVPVQIRGDFTIAVIETHKSLSSGPWTQEEITVLESVSEDLGIALENARLFEETQRKAQRDRITAELASKIWASTDVENILQTAVRELGSALHVSRGTIRLNLPDEAQPEINTDGANRT